MQETWVGSLGWEDPLKKEMEVHSSILVWRLSWTGEPCGLQSMGHKESDTTEGLLLSLTFVSLTTSVKLFCLFELWNPCQ